LSSAGVVGRKAFRAESQSIGIDVGGTFRDGVMLRDGTLTVAKVRIRQPGHQLL
jgi:N-methylhydantoinase A/oxoprolinase/acetone carboxylase beta subunit